MVPAGTRKTLKEEKMKMDQYQIRKEGLKDKARITKVSTKKASDIFKNSKNPDQILLEIYADIGGYQGRIGTIPKPPSKYVSPRSRMAQFLQRYQKPPETGMVVDVITNAKGYWTLLL
jgi:hypothetical protein